MARPNISEETLEAVDSLMDEILQVSADSVNYDEKIEILVERHRELRKAKNQEVQIR